ncbi:Polysaccharide deacetylase [Sporobacter termitidis DSM 10068]|uniref:Polysaccharide deacetylase n=1 Tax=Sporobacter termitidis DSM 10068 TaxID=1123282 RepID=A0A1M5XX77_9FIRM|nr:polysaccharide deacetylase family protein [Sporobacter termitidis]SHI04346.1 Polysaccharide deacetylase [Sporobacter termitidis DSM 10068]
MKRKVTVIVLALCLTILFAAHPAEAADDIYFTAANNTLRLLDNNTMPAMIGSRLYIPCNFFTSDELGVYYIPGGSQFMLYSSTKRLLFDTERGIAADQYNNRQNISAVKKNGLNYVSVDDVCDLFGLTYDYVLSDPAPVIRFYRGTGFINNMTFVSLNKNQMQTSYDAYVGKGSDPGASPASSAPPTVSGAPTSESVTVYLSFYNLTPKNFGAVLDSLDAYRYKSCFFVAADEIVSNADLLRRAAAAGHTIGIWLRDGTLEEYQNASALLFEAAKIRTILVSAGGDAGKTARAAAKSDGLIFWRPIKSLGESDKTTLGSLTGQLSALDSSRYSVNISCTDKMVTLTKSLLGYLAEQKFTVRRLTETTVPTYYIS